MRIQCWTDGSSRHNGKPDCTAGWAAALMLGKKTYIRYGHLSAPSSNNRGEIAGVLFILLKFKDRKDFEFEIYSDSQYVVKSINDWRHKWKNSNYEGIKNADLLIPLFESWEEHGHSRIAWVKGHAGTRGNEIADIWAGKGTRNEVVTITNDMYDIKFVDEKELLNG